MDYRNVLKKAVVIASKVAFCLIAPKAANILLANNNVLAPAVVEASHSLLTGYLSEKTLKAIDVIAFVFAPEIIELGSYFLGISVVQKGKTFEVAFNDDAPSFLHEHEVKELVKQHDINDSHHHADLVDPV